MEKIWWLNASETKENQRLRGNDVQSIDALLKVVKRRLTPWIIHENPYIHHLSIYTNICQKIYIYTQKNIRKTHKHTHICIRTYQGSELHKFSQSYFQISSEKHALCITTRSTNVKCVFFFNAPFKG